MEVHISLVGRKDLTGEIYRQLRRAVLDGRLPLGGRLPPARPGGPAARCARGRSGTAARVTGVPVDDQGLVVDAIPARTRLVHVTPSHQLPLGMPMSLPRRMALLAWARRHDAAVVEDDYDSEFRYGGRPIQPLQTLDRGGRVVYVGSFSKTMLATLRLGFVVAPASLRGALRAAKFVTDWHTALPTQAALAGFIQQGFFARHVRRMRVVYQARHQRIVDALADRFAGYLEVIPTRSSGRCGRRWATAPMSRRCPRCTCSPPSPASRR